MDLFLRINVSTFIIPSPGVLHIHNPLLYYMKVLSCIETLVVFSKDGYLEYKTCSISLQALMGLSVVGQNFEIYLSFITITFLFMNFQSSSG